MNTFVIHVFFTIVVFMLLLVNLKKIKNMFYSEHYEEDGLNTDNNEKIIQELIDNNKEVQYKCGGNRDICLSGNKITDNKNIFFYLDWYSKIVINKKEVNEMYTKDNNLDFYIIYEFVNSKDGNVKSNYYIENVKKWEGLVKQSIFYSQVIDLNKLIDLYSIPRNFDKVNIFVMSEENTIYQLSNQKTFDLDLDNELVSENKMDKIIISCNPDGTYEEGYEKSFRLYPKIGDIKQIKKDIKKISDSLNDKPNELSININKNLFT